MKKKLETFMKTAELGSHFWKNTYKSISHMNNHASEEQGYLLFCVVIDIWAEAPAIKQTKE